MDMNSKVEQAICNIRIQKTKNNAYAAAADLANAAFENKPDAVSFEDLSHQELVQMAKDYLELICRAQMFIKGVSVTLYDTESLLSGVSSTLGEIQVKRAAEKVGA